GAGPDFHVVGLENHASLLRPVVLQGKDELLEGGRRAADFHAADFRHERAREYTVLRGRGCLRTKTAQLHCTRPSASLLHLARLVRALTEAPLWCNNAPNMHQHGA